MKQLINIKYVCAFAIGVFLLMAHVSSGFCEEPKTTDPLKAFYRANTFYEAREYVKALESYDALLTLGFESGNVYYNIGNCFAKLGRLGYAILFYERAKEFMPHDSDLKANLEYVRTLAGDSGVSSDENAFMRILKKPFAELSLNKFTILVIVFYAVLILAYALLIVWPVFGKKMRMVFFIVGLFFCYVFICYGVRYYSENILRRGVVVKKDVDGKYEPIDKATTYYTLREGNVVRVLKTRNDWRYVRRADGKVSWVKKDTIVEI